MMDAEPEYSTLSHDANENLFSLQRTVRISEEKCVFLNCFPQTFFWKRDESEKD